MNKASGMDALKSAKVETTSKDLMNYKGRLVEHRVQKHTTVLSNGKEEVGITEDWVDCEYGISLKHTEGNYNSIPSETYDIVIGEQPKSRFTLPEGYKIMDIGNLAPALDLGKMQEALEAMEAIKNGKK